MVEVNNNMLEMNNNEKINEQNKENLSLLEMLKEEELVQKIKEQTENKKKSIIFSLSDNNFTEVLRFLSNINNLNAIDKNLNRIYKLYLYNNSYIRLNRYYSIRYYEDEEFRTFVHSRVENPSNQLSLDLSECRNITDVSALGGVHTLNLRGCWHITDVSALGGVHTLTLRDCHNIPDVSALGGVHTLTLHCCLNIRDVSALGGVHTLDLSRCYDITDVSALGGVYTLDLSNCYNIEDVSALGGVHTLNLSGCYNITDVSALGDVDTLNLRGCMNITDESLRALNNVPNLTLPYN